MKQTFPMFKGKRKGGVQVKISDIVKLDMSDKEILDRYLTNIAGSSGKTRTNKIQREMLIIKYVSGVGFDKWDYDLLNEFLKILNNSDLSKYSKNDYKKTIKHFLKFQYDDWFKRFKEFRHNGLKQCNPVNKERLSKETLLKPNEFELLVKGAEKPLFRIWIHMAYKTAARPEELLKLKWKDVDLTNGRIKLSSSKTDKQRYIFIDDDGLRDLNHYHENEWSYPNPKKEDFVFVSPVKREVHVSLPTLYYYLKTLSKNKIGRDDINPYLFRHTRLNFLRKKLSPDAYEMFSGHSLETGMKFYSHNDDEDLREELYSKIFDKKEIPKEEREQMQKQLEQHREKIERLLSHEEKVMSAQKKSHAVLNKLIKMQGEGKFSEKEFDDLLTLFKG